MQKPQIAGVIIMIGAVLQMVLFLWAVARRSYLAVALPVAGALAAVSALAFWIGWTLFTSEEEEEEALEEGQGA
ncbi:MAG: hypothetical protein RQ985_04120 [Dehalococcoidia bacterium]|jgi:hypothetical protein|nr:hypothetical protein [Dehalococcoidia bacterium]